MAELLGYSDLEAHGLSPADPKEILRAHVAGQPAADEHMAREALEHVYQHGHTIDLGAVRGNRLKWFRSQCVRPCADVATDQVAIITPILPNGTLLLDYGDEVLLHCIHQHQGFVAHTRVADLGVEYSPDGRPVCAALLDPPVAIYGFQRREHVRVRPDPPLAAEVSYAAPEDTGDAPNRRLVGLMEDISIGGVQIRVDYGHVKPESLRYWTEVSLRFGLPPDGAHLELDADIERITCELYPSSCIWLGLRWHPLGPEATRALVKYIAARSE